MTFRVILHNLIIIQGVPKKWHPFGIWASSLVRCIIYAIFVHSCTIFIKWRRSSSADV